MKYRDISLYRDNAGKYRIACDYPISLSFTGSIHLISQNFKLRIEGSAPKSLFKLTYCTITQFVTPVGERLGLPLLGGFPCSHIHPVLQFIQALLTTAPHTARSADMKDL